MSVPNYALSRLERLYLQIETTYGTIPNTTGTATVGNSNCCRFVKAQLNNVGNLIERPDKTGTRSRPIGVLGRKSAQGSIELSIAPNGTAGVAPDADPLYQALMGQAGAATSGTASITAASSATPVVATATNSFANGDVVYVPGVGCFLLASVSGSAFTLVGSQAAQHTAINGTTASRVAYKYTLSDSIPSLTVWSFRRPSTINQRAMMGTVVSEAQWQFGSDVASHSFTLEALWACESNQFSNEDTIQQGGLSAFPTEPSTPVTNGGIIAGFTGQLVANGNLISTLRTATVRMQTQSSTIKDTFGSYYPTSVQGDVRNFTMEFSIYEDDSAAFANVVAVAEAKTPVTFVLQSGTIAGSMAVLVLNNLQLMAPSSEEQIRFSANFGASSAHASSTTATDEAVLWFY